jgi:hypothetical protein
MSEEIEEIHSYLYFRSGGKIVTNKKCLHYFPCYEIFAALYKHNFNMARTVNSVNCVNGV